jgi:ABC-2 type transport system permease protein
MLSNLIRKEVKEMLTKSIIISMVAMSLIFAFIGQTIASSTKGAAAKAIVAVENSDTGAYASTLVNALQSGARVVYNGSDDQAARAALTAGDGVVLIVIPADFTALIISGQQATIETHWIMKGTGFTDAMPQAIISGLLAQGKSAISAQLIAEQSSLSPEIALNPARTADVTEYKGREVTGLTPGDIANILGTRTLIIPIAVMMLIIMGATQVISSMGMEKENRTLETLLTMPVRRSDIIVAKIVGSAVVGLLMGGIYMAGFANYFRGLGMGNLPGLSALGISLNAGDYALIGLSVFAALMAALCLAIILGTFASNYRSAQTLTFPIVGLAMLPMLLTMFQDFDTMTPALKVVVFLIPFSHPMIAMKSLMLGDYGIVIAGIIYSLLVTAGMVAVAAWIFRTDRVIVGMGRRKSSKIA